MVDETCGAAKHRRCCISTDTDTKVQRHTDELMSVGSGEKASDSAGSLDQEAKEWVKNKERA